MRTLRLLAITGNVAFIGYGALASIGPVLLHSVVLLHLVLLPVNMLQLSQQPAGETHNGSSARPLHNRR